MYIMKVLMASSTNVATGHAAIKAPIAANRAMSPGKLTPRRTGLTASTGCSDRCWRDACFLWSGARHSAGQAGVGGKSGMRETPGVNKQGRH